MSRRLTPAELAAVDRCPCGTERRPFVDWININVQHVRCPACHHKATVGVPQGGDLVGEWNATVRLQRAKRIGSVAPWPPVAGYYATKLVRGGPRVPIRIWFGLAVIDGEAQDRSPGWFVEIDGRTDRLERGEDGYECRIPLDVQKVWPFCAKDPITEAEYRFLIADAAHARDWRPDHPKANPREAVDFNTMRLPF